MTTRAFRKSVLMAGLLAGVTALGACSPIVAQRGALPDVDAIAQVIPNESTKEDVERTLGSPSSVNVFGGETWMYIGESTERTAFFEREVNERSVVLIAFDQNGVVTDVRTHGMEASREIEPVERTTPTVGKELTVLEQIVGNLNRFRNMRGGEQ